MVILAPSRTLRDEHALHADLGVGQILGAVGEGTTGLAQSGEELTGEAAMKRLMFIRVM